MTTPAPPPALLPAPEGPLLLPPEMRAGIVWHARWCRPAEACGLIAVDAGGALRLAYPLTNIEQSPTRFTIDPTEHFGAVRHAEAQGWEIGAVFHSHPSGPASLSPTDLAQPHDPAWLHLVVALSPDTDLKAWRIVSGQPVEVAIVDG